MDVHTSAGASKGVSAKVKPCSERGARARFGPSRRARINKLSAMDRLAAAMAAGAVSLEQAAGWCSISPARAARLWATIERKMGEAS